MGGARGCLVLTTGSRHAIHGADSEFSVHDIAAIRNESDNVEVTERAFGHRPTMNTAREHFDLGEALGQMDFERAAKVSGARFVYLTSGLARLERAIANFMLDLHTGEFGYTEFQPPLLVRTESAFGTGQLPKFEEDLFRTELRLEKSYADRILGLAKSIKQEPLKLNVY